MNYQTKLALFLATSFLFSGLAFAQSKSAGSNQSVIKKTRIAKDGEAFTGTLYATVGGKERKISDGVSEAWLIEKGKSVVYSRADGAGGFENEGQSLRIYDAATGRIKKIMSAYYFVDRVTEADLSNGKTALLVEMTNGGLGASYFAVLDPRRGEVFFRRFAVLNRRAGDRIFLDFYRENDWGTLTEGDADAKKKVKAARREQHDLKKVLLRAVIYNKPSNR